MLLPLQTSAWTSTAQIAKTFLESIKLMLHREAICETLLIVSCCTGICGLAVECCVSVSCNFLLALHC